LAQLQSEPAATLGLLNHLASAGYLSGGLANVQGGRWRQSLMASLQDLLVEVADPSNTPDRHILIQLLRLLSAVSADAKQLAPHFITLVKRFGNFTAGDAETAKADWREGGPLNDAHLFASLLRCVQSYIVDGDMKEQFTIFLVKEGGLAAIIEKWNWNSEVMSVAGGLVVRMSLQYEYVRPLL
jgi:U3 small nucleolar RNA-associated protein 20